MIFNNHNDTIILFIVFQESPSHDDFFDGMEMELMDCTLCLEKTAQQVAAAEIDSYKSKPKSNNPLQFWRDATDLPFMRHLAKKHLCGQPTSVASERIFSTAGDTATASRSRLLADEVDKLIFL